MYSSSDDELIEMNVPGPDSPIGLGYTILQIAHLRHVIESIEVVKEELNEKLVIQESENRQLCEKFEASENRIKELEKENAVLREKSLSALNSGAKLAAEMADIRTMVKQISMDLSARNGKLEEEIKHSLPVNEKESDVDVDNDSVHPESTSSLETAAEGDAEFELNESDLEEESAKHQLACSIT